MFIEWIHVGWLLPVILQWIRGQTRKHWAKCWRWICRMRSQHFAAPLTLRWCGRQWSAQVCLAAVQTGNKAPEADDAESLPPALDCQAPFHLYTTVFVTELLNISLRMWNLALACVLSELISIGQGAFWVDLPCFSSDVQFLPRDATQYVVCLSVCPSVRLRRSGTVL